jgi:paraquat-inducible protein B
MSDRPTNEQPVSEQPGNPAPGAARATVRRRRGFSAIWLLPIVAGLIGGYLAVTNLSKRGPTITITFRSADGLTAGQTKVKHKAVDLGTVESIRLSDDLSHAIVRIAMQAEAAPYLTDKARFWVVRPRLSGSNISGLETLISGAYIEMDPGDKGGTANEKREFTALETPPGVRSDEPGLTIQLKTGRIGSLGSGSPVFYRDIVVGEVLGYTLPEGTGPITVQAFIRAPYDKRVRTGTRFWNASGLRIELGSQGVHVELESLQAVLSGGIAFNTPQDSRDSATATPDATFQLFASENDADAASFKERLPYVLYFQTSAAGLSVGAPVQLYGIQIGNVTSVALQFDPVQATARVRVGIEVQPERLTSLGGRADMTPEEVARHLVARGMRAELSTISYLTGTMAVSLEFPPNPAPAEITHEGDAIVLPTEGGGLAGLTTQLSEIVQKVDSIPFAQIGGNANALLGTLNALLGGPEVKQALGSLTSTLVDVQGLVKRTDAGLAPVLRRLPEMSADLQQTLSRASHLVGSADSAYGSNSQFQRDLERLMAQLNDTARSIRLLADFLDRHPEALIRGRTAQGADR